jgi:hypothetical protein
MELLQRCGRALPNVDSLHCFSSGIKKEMDHLVVFSDLYVRKLRQFLMDLPFEKQTGAIPAVEHRRDFLTATTIDIQAFMPVIPFDGSLCQKFGGETRKELFHNALSS